MNKETTLADATNGILNERVTLCRCNMNNIDLKQIILMTAIYMEQDPSGTCT